MAGFCRFTRRMVARQFHAFGVQRQDLMQVSIDPSASVVVYANHAGWWDPIVAMLLCQAYFKDRTLYAPIDADALNKYRVMKSMGFYGLKFNSLEGAAEFLVRTQTILEAPATSVWITPEGRFCDVRDRSQPLMPGLAHLAHKMPGVHFIPLAIEYPFWNESYPLILIRLGTPVVSHAPLSKSVWGERLTEGLRSTQQALAESVIARDPAAFEFLIENHRRRSWYDYARSWVAWVEGKPFDPRHDS